jgi:hypothetical protein
VQLGQTIYGNENGDLCGWSVDDTAQGGSIVLGCLGNNHEDRRGYVRVISLDSNDVAVTGTWKQIGQVITGEAIGDLFGKSVSISDDGKTIAVGADINDGKNGEESGHVSIFRLETMVPAGNRSARILMATWLILIQELLCLCRQMD